MSCINQNNRNKDNIDSVKPYPHTININAGLKNNTILKLSEIADSIRYVVLSKNKEVIIGSFRRLQMAGDDIYINAMPWLAGLFNFNGKLMGVLKNPLDNVPISEPDLKRVILTNPFFTHFDNRIVLSPEGDTIYEVDQDSIFPGFIIDWGPIPHDQTYEDLYFRQSESSNKASVSGFFLETKTKAYCRLSSGDDYYILEYDKVTGETRSMKEDKDNPGFMNDLDGGANYLPYWTNRTGDIWIVYDDAFSFKNKHSEEFLMSSAVINSEKKEKLKSFLQSLKPDDNPVLKIVYLKK